MTIELGRREFLTATAGASLCLGGGGVSVGRAMQDAAVGPGLGSSANPSDWAWVRDQFPLTRDYVHLATFLLASHPRIVAEAIERHRAGFDANPADYLHERFIGIDGEICNAVARYTGGQGSHIALTDSTTMGLGLVYNAIKLKPQQEIVVGAHGHYSTLMSCEYRAQRDGARVRSVEFYEDPASASVDEIVSRMLEAISEWTRVLAVTWVHSSTGVKMPLRAMADALKNVNAGRDEDDRVLMCVDGVHGFGNQAEKVSDLGCDIFVAGTHKWMFGPRGTGIIWAKPEVWEYLRPVIPSFGMNYGAWLGLVPTEMVPPGSMMTPGGFHSFEHRWALPEAFAFHEQIGPKRIHERITALNTRCKEGLAAMKHVKVHTPIEPELSAGIICFEFDETSPDDFEGFMHTNHVIASTSPYRNSYPRLAPSILNDEAEVDQALALVARLK